MRIRDDVFLNAASEPKTVEPRRRLSAADVALLRGVGDRDFRSAQDTLQAAGLIDDDTTVFTAGKQVEYTTPDGVVRTGAVVKQAAADSWLVSVDDNTYNIVPTAELRIAAPAKLDANALRAAVQKTVTSSLREHRAVEARGNDLSVVLAYNVGQRPADDDVAAYVAANYDGARVLDVADTQPGKLALMITHEAAVPAIPAQERSPGLAAEELEGDATNTPLATVTAAITTLAAELPHTVHVTSTERFVAADKTQAVRANFELLAADDSKLFLRDNELTTEDTTVPAVGYIDSVTKTARLYGADGEFALVAALTHTANPVLAAATWLIEHPAVVASIVEAYPAVRDFVQGDVTLESAKKLVEEIGPDVVSTFMKHAGGADVYQSGHGPQSIHENEESGFEDGSYVITAADLNRTAAPTGPAYDYRKEKAKWDETHPDSATDDNKAKERRKQLNKERSQRHEEEFAPQGASPATDEEDGDVREVLVPPTNPDFKQQIMAVDQTTKDYYKEYFGDIFGDALTGDVPRKKHKAQMGGVPIIQAVSGLASLATSNDKVRADVGAALRNYLSRGSKASLVDTLMRVDTSNQLLPKLIYAAFSDPQSSKEMSKVYIDHRKSMPIGELPPAQENAEKAKDDAAAAKPADPFKVEDTSAVGQLAQQEFEPVEMTPGQSAQFGPGAETQQPAGQLPAAGPGVRQFDPETQQWFDRAGSALNAGRKRRANLLSCMRMTDVVRDGDYIAATVVWDPDKCQGMSTGNVRHSVISFVKGEATKKESHDYGVIGRPVIMMFDPEAGMADVRFRSSESRAVPPKVVL